MKRIPLLINFLFSISIFSLAQSEGNGNSYSVPKIEDLVKIPPSPEAQAFTKYGNIPVNLYTGVPDITIPIYTIQGREINIPISLSYDASGIKVEQIATAAGIGWNLNYGGGMITRRVHGYPDDYFTSQPTYIPFYEPSLKPDYDFANIFSASEGQYYPPGDLVRFFGFMDNAIKTGAESRVEIQPDVYNFSFLGLSGTLFIDYANNAAHCIEHPEMKITPIFQIYGTPQIKIITGWIIMDATGNTYYFEAAETTTVNENNEYDGSRVYYSAWALTRIVSKTKKDIVEFSYGNTSWTQPKLAGRADYRIDVGTHNTPCGNDQMFQPQYTSPTYSIDQLEITSIQINGKTVVNFLGKSRADLSGKGALDEIIIYDQSNTQISKYKFLHSYFGPASTTNENEIKLRLDGIEIYGNVSSTSPLRYQFYYHDGAFPSRESFAQDFWGYYNGQSGNTTLIPYNGIFDEANWEYYNWKGARRIPNLEYAKVGTLHTIVYPTGGKSEFDYQLHRVNSTIPAYESTVQNVVRGSNSLPGGNITENTYNYCDDAVPTPPYPRGSDISFNIPESGYHDIKFYASGPVGPGSYIQFAALYQAGESMNFCELFNWPAIVKYYGNYASPTNVKTTAYLQSGTYRIFLLNNNPDVVVGLEVWGTEIVEAIGDPHSVGGLRISKITDKDEIGNIISRRLFYYGDLSTVNSSSISQSFITSSNLASGTLHDYPEFETSKVRKIFEDMGEYTCYSTTRISNNRTNSSLHVTYPFVTEVQFGSDNLFNGFTVYEFINAPESHIDGYSKLSVLNGKINSKRTYNNNGQLLSSERNFYSQRHAGDGGPIAFYFRHNPQIDRDDLYIKHPVGLPGQEFFHYGPKLFSLGQEQHCVLSDPNNVKIYCNHFDGEWQKTSYRLPRYWATNDSTLVRQYSNGNYFESVTRNFFDNSDHYQITRIESKDSKGAVKKIELSYPHELQAFEPTNPIWSNLISQHRIGERIQTKSTLGSNQPDFLQTTEYKNITVGSNSVYVPDITKLSSGNGSLEPRIRYHQYDNAGNIVELSKENDSRTAYQWGYNQTFPIAVVKNALVNEIFHTSFEAGEEGGNSSDNDCKTGLKSKTGGYSKTLTGLTPNKAYVLTYWRKSSGVWSLQTVNIAASSATSYTISLTGQVDEIRFFPVGALMTTYTYRPGISITSLTDANNQTTYYEYDNMGRLWLVRDFNKKIIKEHKYNYRLSNQ
jgi:hypothetical protein